MRTSARNHFTGQITEVKPGAVNDEVALRNFVSAYPDTQSAGEAVGVLGCGEDDGVGVLNGCADRGDGGRHVCAVGIEEGNVAELSEDLEMYASRREEGRGLQQEQVAGADAEAAGDGEDAVERTHFKMIAGECI